MRVRDQIAIEAVFREWIGDSTPGLSVRVIMRGILSRQRMSKSSERAHPRIPFRGRHRDVAATTRGRLPRSPTRVNRKNLSIPSSSRRIDATSCEAIDNEFKLFSAEGPISG